MTDENGTLLAASSGTEHWRKEMLNKHVYSSLSRFYSTLAVWRSGSLFLLEEVGPQASKHIGALLPTAENVPAWDRQTDGGINGRRKWAMERNVEEKYRMGEEMDG